ncbi:MAG: hypothetical protein KDE19_08515 [Caldilineaceae bacterium]|nr:hypothetical protein [Caldilineaceae bacterium]
MYRTLHSSRSQQRLRCTLLVITLVMAEWLLGGRPRDAIAALSFQTDGPTLTVANNLSVPSGDMVTVPIAFRQNGAQVAGLSLSLDFDQTCLAFNPTDGNGDSVPDAISFDMSPQFFPSVSFSTQDTDGEIDFIIADYSPPLTTFADSDMLITIQFTAVCEPTTPAGISSTIGFSTQPTVSFSDANGQDVFGSTTAGSLLILPAGATSQPGDCNADQRIDAGDLAATVLEIFDGDGNAPNAAAGGTFAGSPACDSNEDAAINAGDLSCLVLIIFNGPGACVAGAAAVDKTAQDQR